MHVHMFCIGATVLAAAWSFLSHKYVQYRVFIPSGVAVAVGMYITPNFSIPRIVGACIQYAWLRKRPIQHDHFMVVVASGFILGEGLTSILTALCKTVGVPQLT